ncbi:MAG TPA: M48 family metalloprotease [Rhodoferax sp.]|nr:M48 family metalloprotease [Rhodoferax sp.]
MTKPLQQIGAASSTAAPPVFKRKIALAPVLHALAASILIATGSLHTPGLSAQTGADSSALAAGSLPLLGDGSERTSGAERRLGDRIVRELYRDPDYLDDPVLSDYVQGIWQPLLAAARLRGDLTAELDERFAWQTLMGYDRSVNAFALPGGYFGLHLGLLAVVSSRDELASVLGHELSHVTQRHVSRLISKSNQQTPWMIGAMILGALAASKSADAGSALMVGGQALTAQNQLNFSRDMEREADRLGFGVMTQAGFEPIGFVTMFDKLQQAARLNDNGAYPYLRSHPLTTERIADMQSRLPLGMPQGVVPTPTVLHAMMVARARVLSNAGIDALRGWQGQADDPGLLTQPRAKQVAALYGATMAASRLRDAALAQRNQQRLQTLVAGDRPALQQARWLGIEIALAANDLAVAQALLTQANGAAAQATDSADRSPQRPALLLQAQVALKAGTDSALESAAQGLQTWVSQQTQDALAWQSLASIYAAQGQGLRALRAQAEARVAQLDYPGALDRLRAAQDYAAVASATSSSARHIDASIIDTRRHQIELLLKEQAPDR